MLINYKLYKYISLRIHTAWSEYLQGTLWVDKNPKRLQADSKDSDQPAQADLSLRWVHMQSCASARMFWSQYEMHPFKEMFKGRLYKSVLYTIQSCY